MDNSVEKELFKKRNVVAVAKGEKWSGGQNTGEEAVLVFVNDKKEEKHLDKDDIVPQKIDGIVTDVVGKTGTIKPFSNISKVRPLIPGYSVGHLWVTAGTLGAFFEDSNGEIVGLSNNHVLAATNRGICWDGYRGHWTVQPGVYDDGVWRRNKVGNLKLYKKINGIANYEDSAIFKIDDNVQYETSIPNIGDVLGFNDDVKIGDVLQKNGRTTGYRKASVIAIDGTVNVDYGSTTYVFKDQIITQNIGAGGDSGSLVLDMNGNAVGLLFAGSDTITIHNKIKYPRQTYGLKVINTGVQIDERISFSINFDDASVANDYGINDLDKVINFARQKAR